MPCNSKEPTKVVPGYDIFSEHHNFSTLLKRSIKTQPRLQMYEEHLSRTLPMDTGHAADSPVSRTGTPNIWDTKDTKRILGDVTGNALLEMPVMSTRALEPRSLEIPAQGKGGRGGGQGPSFLKPA
ncbi:hypothetical protein MGN70_013804 [Eutypa lata]|nr:hypothetical protein MGN70_013804 [Eutypa lata]